MYIVKPEEFLNERLEFDEYAMGVAWAAMRRGTCRLQVGAAVTKDGQILATGYNGSPPKQPHCVGPGGIGCHWVTIDDRQHCDRTIHAEDNAIFFAGPEAQGGEVYVTDRPCRRCSSKIARAKLRKVFYCRDYVDHRTDEILAEANIEIIQLPPPRLVVPQEMLDRLFAAERLVKAFLHLPEALRENELGWGCDYQSYVSEYLDKHSEQSELWLKAKNKFVI